MQPHTHPPDHTRRTCSHTIPPLLPWPHTPSHPRSLTHSSNVSRSKMPAGSTLILLSFRSRCLGTTRGGSQPSHTPPAHARWHACPCPYQSCIHVETRTDIDAANIQHRNTHVNIIDTYRRGGRILMAQNTPSHTCSHTHCLSFSHGPIHPPTLAPSLTQAT
jgi:hypothetical protein